MIEYFKRVDWRMLISQGIYRCLLVSLFASLFVASDLCAQTSLEKHLPLDGNIKTDGSAVYLSWFDAKPPRIGDVIVKRRLLGDIGGDSWHEITPALGPVMRFTDDTVEPGIAYEYQVLRKARDIIDVGYWTTGVEVPAQEFRGTAIVIIEESIAAPLAARLKRFELDLIGDGWKVIHHETSRGNDENPVGNLARARALKEWLRDRYLMDPFEQYSLILVGHVPIVKSGRAAPDGHGARAHASDLFYADIDGVWSDNRDGVLLPNQLPNDAIEMQVGRIDFSTMSDDDPDLEVDLLRFYFDKNHHWRQGMIGDLRTAYGNSPHLLGEQYALRNIVGPKAVARRGHRKVGELHPTLWGVARGNAKVYAENSTNGAVFTINFGSYKQMIEKPFNAMNALLAQPWYTIACGWGGRPTWWLHHMALGGTIGESHLRTVNNGKASKPYRDTMDYFPTGNYLWRNPVWVNLLGDPTTHAFILSPPQQARARKTGQGVRLSWTPSFDPDVIGYRIYRAAAEDEAFAALEAGALVEGREYFDAAPPLGVRYMIRAYGLKRVYAGSFFVFSQGAFAEVGRDPVQALDRTIFAAPGQPVRLMEGNDLQAEGTVQAFIEGPRLGQLRRDGGGWLYTPPTVFNGKVWLRFSISDEFGTDEGALTVLNSRNSILNLSEPPSNKP